MELLNTVPRQDPPLPLVPAFLPANSRSSQGSLEVRPEVHPRLVQAAAARPSQEAHSPAVVHRAPGLWARHPPVRLDLRLEDRLPVFRVPQAAHQALVPREPLPDRLARVPGRVNRALRLAWPATHQGRPVLPVLMGRVNQVNRGNRVSARLPPLLGLVQAALTQVIRSSSSPPRVRAFGHQVLPLALRASPLVHPLQ